MSKSITLFAALNHENLLGIAYLGEPLNEGLLYANYLDAVATLPTLQPVPDPGATTPAEPVDTSLLCIDIKEATVASLVADGALEVVDVGYRVVDGAKVRESVCKTVVERRPSNTVTARTTLYLPLAIEDVSAKPDEGVVGQDGAWAVADMMSQRQTDLFKRKLKLFGTREFALASLGKLDGSEEVALVTLQVPNHRFTRAIDSCKRNKARGYEMDERVSVLLADHALIGLELISGNGFRG